MSGMIINPFAFTSGGGGGGDAYTFYRLLIRYHEAGGSDSYYVGELELRETIGGSQAATGGTASAISEASGFEASKAFDGTTAGYWAGGSGAVDAWIQYELPSAISIVQYVLKAGAIGNRTPSEWKLQGSNDGAAWTTLDHQTGQTGWAAEEARAFTLAEYTQNADAHRIWRLSITANNGDGTYVGTRWLCLRDQASGPQVAAYGTVGKSDEFSGAYAASNAFGAAISGNGWLVGHGGTWPEWIEYDFGENWPQAIVEYAVAISGASSPASRSAKDWNLQYSDDGSLYTTADAVTGETSWTTAEVRTFTT